MDTLAIPEFHKEPSVCGICFVDINPLELQVEMACHSYCFGCWTSWAKECVRDGRVPDIPCLTEGCKNALSCQFTIAMLFENETLTLLQYHTKSLYKSIELPDRLVRCSGSCQAWWIADTSACYETACPTCKMEICSNCSCVAHPDMTCEEYQNFIGSPDGWIGTFAKKCPKCAVDIQKNGGCNSMTCSQCNFVFCWMCRTPFGSEGNNHSECYNRMASEEHILNATMRGTQENETTRFAALTGTLNTNRVFSRRTIQRLRNAAVRNRSENRHRIPGAARFYGDEEDAIEHLDEFLIGQLFDEQQTNTASASTDDFDLSGLFDAEDDAAQEAQTQEGPARGGVDEHDLFADDEDWAGGLGLGLFDDVEQPPAQRGLQQAQAEPHSLVESPPHDKEPAGCHAAARLTGDAEAKQVQEAAGSKGSDAGDAECRDSLGLAKDRGVMRQMQSPWLVAVCGILAAAYSGLLAFYPSGLLRG